MPGRGHYIERCKYCDAVMGQCRCPGPKETRYGVCSRCAKNIALGVPLYPPAPIDVAVPDPATTPPAGIP